MGQLESAQALIEGWVIDPYEHGLLDGPGNAVHLPIINGQTVHTDAMPQGITMFIDWEGVPEVFLKPVPKGPSQFPNVFPPTTYLGALKPIDYPIFLGNDILILGGHQKVMDGVVSFEMHLYPHFVVTFLKLLLSPLV